VWTLSSNITTATQNFGSPIQVTLLRVGIQCVCFNADSTLIYILDSLSYLVQYNISNNVLKALVGSSRSGVTDCYYDSYWGGLVFVKSTTTTTNL
jgi:hypothetical protein